MKNWMREPATIVREYGPFREVTNVGGVTFDGTHVWFAAGESMRVLDPQTGEESRSVAVRATAGTAFDGKRLYQLSDGEILTLDPLSGAVLARIPAPGPNPAGLTWAEGSPWVALHRERKILRLDPLSGAVLRTIETERCVTGVTFVEGDLWYGTWEGEESDIRCADKESGQVAHVLTMPPRTVVSGLEWDGKETLYAGGGRDGKVRAIRRPSRSPSRRAG